MTPYLEHFKLREAPFPIAPDAAPFFSGANREATLQDLIRAVTGETGIIEVSGEFGSGKSTLSRALAEQLTPQTSAIQFAGPSLTGRNLLTTLTEKLGLPQQTLNENSGLAAILNALHHLGTDKQFALLIDDAQALPGEALNTIQEILEHEAHFGKSLRIVLFREPAPKGEQTPLLAHLTTRRFKLASFQRDETAAYVDWRLRHAGYSGTKLFSDSAIDRINQASAGLPRQINLLADKALRTACAKGKTQVDADDARTATQETRLTLSPTSQGAHHQRKIWIAVAISAGVIAVAALSGRLHPPAAPATKTVTIQPSQSPDNAPLKPLAPAGKNRKVHFGPLTRQHMTQFDAWIETAPPTHYFIQLLTTDAAKTGQIEGFLASATEALDPSLVRAYRSSLSGHDRIGVIYGDFATREDAVAAMQSLPDSIKAAQPFPRQVSRLR